MAANADDVVTVLEANKNFYSAFRDFDEMNAIWAQTEPVFCLHPGQEPIIGRVAVLESWREIISYEQLDIAPANAQVLWFGELAVVVCEEVIAGVEPDEIMIASNVFVRQDNVIGWGIAGHHAGRKT